METLQEVTIIVAGFLLRLGVPVALTALLAWLLHRLDARWQEEAENLEVSRWIQVEEPTQPCWVDRDCGPSTREECPAYHQSEIPCWQIFRDEQGNLKEDCLSCELFRSTSFVMPEEIQARRYE